MGMCNREDVIRSLIAASEMIYTVLVRFYAGLFGFVKYYYYYYFESFEQVPA